MSLNKDTVRQEETPFDKEIENDGRAAGRVAVTYHERSAEL
jgi:hypothetical protein